MPLIVNTPKDKQPDKPEIKYPCNWNYKVIGQDCTLLKEVIVSVCGSETVRISHSNMSSGGKYHSLSAELIVHSEEMRLEIYENLKAHPAVKLVL